MRKPVACPPIKSWDEADQALRQIGELEIQKRLKEDRAQLEVNEIRERLKDESAPIAEEISRLGLCLQAFCEIERQKKNFKSKILTFGSVFFRKTTSLVTRKGVKWAGVVNRLVELQLEQYLHVKRSVNREAMKKSGLTQEELDALNLGLVLQEEAPFKYEINEERFVEQCDPTDADIREAAARG